MAYKPTPTDGVSTGTSKSQSEVENTLSALFELSKPESYTLNRVLHLNWLIRPFKQGFPTRYQSQDASQPWLLFWTLQSFQTLGASMDPQTKQRAVNDLLRSQHPNGGFGGGPGQNAHLLSNYAAVCSLAIVGGPGANGGWDQINREKMYEWFMSLKQPDGSFLVSQHAEVDMRGIYCLLVVATLLDIITIELIDGLRGFIASCQTYEGGFSAASQPYFSASPPSLETLLSSPRPPLGEAHGGYTFCALASLFLLQPIDPYPDDDETFLGVDLARLYRWASSLQGLEIEGGGFKGRTNKLVDGCYSWWVGGLFPLLDQGLGVSEYFYDNDSDVDENSESKDDGEKKTKGHDDEDWSDDEGSLYNRQAVQNFILVSSQSATGGLRDKPSRHADAYHTLYNLSGLSSAQHRVYKDEISGDKIATKWRSKNTTSSGEPMNDKELRAEEYRRRVFISSMSWVEDESASRYVGTSANRVNATHPVFDLTISATKAFMNHFYKQNC